jgi:hypothetical protein
LGAHHTTSEQKQMARRLRAKGLKFEDIARELNVTYHLARAAANRPGIPGDSSTLTIKGPGGQAGTTRGLFDRLYTLAAGSLATSLPDPPNLRQSRLSTAVRFVAPDAPKISLMPQRGFVPGEITIASAAEGLERIPPRRKHLQVRFKTDFRPG